MKVLRNSRTKSDCTEKLSMIRLSVPSGKLKSLKSFKIYILKKIICEIYKREKWQTLKTHVSAQAAFLVSIWIIATRHGKILNKAFSCESFRVFKFCPNSP